MSYLSLEFLSFFLAFLFLYWSCKASPVIQNLLILLASYAFYTSIDTKFTLILLAYTVITYIISEQIQRRRSSQLWLYIGITIAMSNLAIFKYFDFFRVELQNLFYTLGFHAHLPGVDLLLPVGISFFTFQSITYLVSIYRNELTPVKIGDYALFVAFFPTLLSGPICRANHLLPQLLSHQPRRILEVERIFVLILLALLKKLVFASWLAEHWVDPVFDDPNSQQGLTVLLGILAYTLQIYFDFSGYTDLVTALALLLGFRLPQNFNAPYLATNIKDFWNRWHISLSTWIRDYIYIPLGGNRHGFMRTQLYVMVAMLLSGIWHGASTQFILWGAIHGFAIVSLNALHKTNICKHIDVALSRLFTFSFVAFAWVFFHAPTLTDSINILQALGNWGSAYPIDKYSLAFLSIVIIWYSSLPLLSKSPQLLVGLFKSLPWWLTPIPFVLGILIILSFAPSGVPSFIYYQF